ncbi:hypothetical protein [Streptomyces sp. NPDC005828]|uniref:hypothetical protein n=1 Tax=Streptomyces sp. NPDC005828 TaxID=3157071 RepID=UPI0033C56BA2
MPSRTPWTPLVTAAWKASRTGAGRASACAGVRPGSVPVSRDVNTAPSAATPSEPPMVRTSTTVPLAAPMSRGSALYIVISIVDCIRKPMPAPRTTVGAEGDRR